jgi:hypothetical protein
MRRNFFCGCFTVIALLLVHLDEQATAQSDLAQQAQNPIASLAAVPLQSNWDFGVGPDKRTRYVGVYQPVIPFKLNEDWSFISRMVVPVINAPIDLDGNVHGLGDSSAQFFFSPLNDSKFIWGVGPNVLLPTRSDPRLGVGDWGVGVNGVGLLSDGPLVFGALLSQTWGMGGNTNPFLFQPFFNYNFDKGYFVSVSGEFSADWELPENERWSIPFGPGCGRTFAVKGQPLTINCRFAPYLEAPTNGPEWQFRTAISFLFPKKK